jgi:hypothetical protein
MQWAINYFADFIDPGNFRRRGKVTLKANRSSSGAILFATSRSIGSSFCDLLIDSRPKIGSRGFMPRKLTGREELENLLLSKEQKAKKPNHQLTKAYRIE